MRPLHFQRYLITGLLTIVPLWLTWVVFKFVFAMLAEASAPLVAGVLAAISTVWPAAAGWRESWIMSIIAFISTLLLLYLIGFAASRVIGQRLIDAVEGMLERVPVVHSIYGGAKKMMTLLRNKPGGTQRVVLIAFPSPELKSIGFVTRVFHDSNGRELAAVYVPTTPNPTGGYLEIVPVEYLQATDWSVDQAMAFVLSAGAVAPDTLPFATHWSDRAPNAESSIDPPPA